MTRLTDSKLIHFAHNAAARAESYQYDIAPTRSPYSGRNAARMICDEIQRRVNALKPSQHVRRGLLLRAFAAANLAFGIYDQACDAAPF